MSRSSKKQVLGRGISALLNDNLKETVSDITN